MTPEVLDAIHAAAEQLLDPPTTWQLYRDAIAEGVI